MPQHAREVKFSKRIVIPTADLIARFRAQLTGVTVTDAAFEELVRQCMDVYLEWQGDESAIAELPNLNRIDIPELGGENGEVVYEKVTAATSEFACELFGRLIDSGLFQDGNTHVNINYAFDQFLGRDIVLFHLAF
jgi:hypothetical protein